MYIAFLGKVFAETGRHMLFHARGAQVGFRILAAKKNRPPKGPVLTGVVILLFHKALAYGEDAAHKGLDLLPEALCFLAALITCYNFIQVTKCSSVVFLSVKDKPYRLLREILIQIL